MFEDEAGVDILNAFERQVQNWPRALTKAASDYFTYALGLRNGTVIRFSEATPTAGGFWVWLKEPDILSGPGNVPSCGFSFDRGLEVRVEEIAWVADAPWGS
jgi:hypothetical protein